MELNLLERVQRAVQPTEPDRGYETWTKRELYARAKELDVKGRASMNKGELIRALRNRNE